jgi:alanyl-tRNA synthetase
MTARLYHFDAYRRECATVVTGERDAGGRRAVALAETVFYAAGGGQLSDRGVIAGVDVVDVRDEDGEIWHVLGGPAPGAADAPAPRSGDRVSVFIDWNRRFDHMQQHTGQHVLSQAFVQVLDAQTLSVHMEQTCTVDLSLPALDAVGAERVERLANTVVLENRPVTVREVDAGEATALGLRRPPKQTGVIRVVEVTGFDWSACGGTHVRATGEVGSIVIRGWERYKGGVRVEFLCGWRALRDYRWSRSLLRDVTGRLTTGEDELVAAVIRLQKSARDLERDLDAARRALLDVEAGRLIADAEATRAGPEGQAPLIIAAVFEGRPIEDLRALARAVTARGRCVAILATEPDRRLVIARSADVALDAGAVVRTALAPFGGRGGGRSEAGEGAAAGAPSSSAIVEAVQALVAQRSA